MSRAPLPGTTATTAAATVPGLAAPELARTRRRQRLALALVWLTPALWSTNHVVARAAEGVVAPHALALYRWALALLLMLPFTLATLRAAPRLWLAEWPRLLVLGGLGMWVCGAFVYQGGHTTSALNMSLIYAVCPVGIAACSVLLLHERFSTTQRAAMALALAGVLYIIAHGDVQRLLAVQFTGGDAWIVVAAAGWVAYSVLLSRWPSVLAPAARLSAIIIGGLVLLLPFTLIEAWWAPQPPLSWRAAGLIGAAALLPGALSYTAYSYIQRELGAARTALMLYLAPVYAALLAWALLGEAPQAYHAVGAALILPSIWLATRSGVRR